MELSITYQGNHKGTLSIEKQGLYYLYSAECSFRPQVPMRLYAVNDLQSKTIGVLTQDGQLQKRISARAAEPLPQRVIAGTAEEGFLPWCGKIEDEAIEDAYIKQDGTQSLLAMPVSDGGEVPLLAYASQMQPVTVCGRQCLALPLQDGKPIAVEPEPQTEEESEAEALPEGLSEEDLI